jgi:hypothetical protein
MEVLRCSCSMLECNPSLIHSTLRVDHPCQGPFRCVGGSVSFPQEIHRFDAIRLDSERETARSLSEGCFEPFLGSRAAKDRPSTGSDSLCLYAGSAGRNSRIRDTLPCRSIPSRTVLSLSAFVPVEVRDAAIHSSDVPLLHLPAALSTDRCIERFRPGGHNSPSATASFTGGSFPDGDSP